MRFILHEKELMNGWRYIYFCKICLERIQHLNPLFAHYDKFSTSKGTLKNQKISQLVIHIVIFVETAAHLLIKKTIFKKFPEIII